MHRWFLLTAAAWLAACSNGDPTPSGGVPRTVVTAPATVVSEAATRLSGTVHARFETAVAFEVPGRILTRRVDAGERVAAGDVLLRLDPEEFSQAVAVARADLAAARAELETARAETRRNRDLLAREFISPQVFERVQLAEESARERVDAARARLEQAEIRRRRTELTAAADGVLLEVTGEPGRVVAAGEPVAVLAHGDAREVAVSLPVAAGVPESGRLIVDGRAVARLRLRAVAGGADPVTRTWPARYTILGADRPPRLRSVVRVALDGGGRDDLLQVPVGAINERGDGPRVWTVVDGRARPVPVTLVDLDTEHARIAAELAPGTRVIALGTHLLEPGMPVRDRGR